MALIGEVPRYWGTYEDFPSFVERLDQLFALNNITEDKKKPMLINCIDQTIYVILRDICFPESPSDKTYEELCTLMEKQFAVKTSAFRERRIFYRAQQKEDESVQEWFDRIKKLSLECRLGGQYSSILLDRFISGLKSSAIVDRLCEEDVGQLKLEHALSVALAKEASIRKSEE